MPQRLQPQRRSSRSESPVGLRDIIEKSRVDQVTTHDWVLHSLRRAIMSGVLVPGMRLPQEDLATYFGTSRIPIREALRALEIDGLVTSTPNRGFTVTALDEHDVEEIYDLRAVLEAEALRLAVPMLTEVDEAELTALLHAIREASDPDEEVVSRDRFYLRLYSVSGRPRLVGLIMRLRHDTSRVLGWSSSGHSSAVHEQVLDAVRAGDSELAIRLITDHYRRASGLIRRRIRAASTGLQGPSRPSPRQPIRRDGDSL